MSQPQQRRFMLPESELPTHFYNISADLAPLFPIPFVAVGSVLVAGAWAIYRRLSR